MMTVPVGLFGLAKKTTRESRFTAFMIASRSNPFLRTGNSINCAFAAWVARRVHHER